MDSFGAEIKQTGDQEHSYDEPLFVLKYQGTKVFFRLLFYTFGIVLLSAVILAIPTAGTPEMLCKTVLGIMVLFLVQCVVELLSFSELRLYNDRIVQVRKWGETEVGLAHARMTASNYYRDKGPTLITSQSSNISREWLPRLIYHKGMIVYWDSLADPEEAKRLNGLLAHLSASNIPELETGCIASGKLVKEGYHPKTITKDTPTEALVCPAAPLSPDDPEKASRRKRAQFVIIGLVILFQLCVTAYIIWLRHQ